jgi:hypothetical protein
MKLRLLPHWFSVVMAEHEAFHGKKKLLLKLCRLSEKLFLVSAAIIFSPLDFVNPVSF